MVKPIAPFFPSVKFILPSAYVSRPPHSLHSLLLILYSLPPLPTSNLSHIGHTAGCLFLGKQYPRGMILLVSASNMQRTKLVSRSQLKQVRGEGRERGEGEQGERERGVIGQSLMKKKAYTIDYNQY